MPNRYQQFGSKIYYHIYNRSLNGESLFFVENDYKRFYDKMIQLQGDVFKENELFIRAWNIMPNHFHLLIIFNQGESDIISKFMHRLQTSYSMYFNSRYSHKGQLFEGRFKAKQITDDNYVWTVINYIQKNSEKHLNINHQGRPRRSDIKVDLDIPELYKNIDDYKIE